MSYEGNGTGMHHDRPVVGFAALTKRENEILPYIAAGYSYQRIGDVFECSERTIRAYASHMLGKLQMENRTKMAVLALIAGVVDAAQIYKLMRAGELSYASELTRGLANSSVASVATVLERDYIEVPVVVRVDLTVRSGKDSVFMVRVPLTEERDG